MANSDYKIPFFWEMDCDTSSSGVKKPIAKPYCGNTTFGRGAITYTFFIEIHLNDSRGNFKVTILRIRVGASKYFSVDIGEQSGPPLRRIILKMTHPSRMKLAAQGLRCSGADSGGCRGLETNMFRHPLLIPHPDSEPNAHLLSQYLYGACNA